VSLFLCGVSAMQRQFDDTMAKVPVRELRAAYIAVEQEREYVDEVRVWFWRWRPQWRVRVEERLPALEAAEARLADLVAQRDAIMAEARQVVGIWSEYAVEEARESFWSSVEAGKVRVLLSMTCSRSRHHFPTCHSIQGVAKRATFYDAFFSMFQMRRDESIGSFLLGLLVKFVFNLTFGLLLMLVAFLVSLVGFIYTWGPGVLSGTLFFLVAGLGATAAVTGIIALGTSWWSLRLVTLDTQLTRVT